MKYMDMLIDNNLVSIMLTSIGSQVVAILSAACIATLVCVLQHELLFSPDKLVRKLIEIHSLNRVSSAVTHYFRVKHFCRKTVET